MQSSVFQNKNFVLSILGALVSNIGAVFYSFVVGFWLLELTSNNAMIQGAYLGLCGVVYVIVTLFGGVLADRFHKARIMVICDFAKGLLILVTTLLIMIGKDNTASVVILFVCGVFSNVISAIFSPAASSIYPLIVPEEQLQQANSYQTALLTFQGIIGTFLAGVLYGVASPYTIFFIVSGCYIASGVSEMFIRYEDVGTESKLTVKESFRDIRDGAGYVFSSKTLSVFILMILIINFFFSPISENFVPYLIKTDVASHAHIWMDTVSDEMWQSVFITAFSIGSVIFAVAISCKDLSTHLTKNLKFTLSALALALVAETASYYIFVEKGAGFNAFLIISTVLFFAVGGLISMTNIPATTKLQTIVEKDKLGKVSSILNVGAMGLTPLSSFLAGIVLEYAGIFTLLTVCSIGMMIPLVLLFASKAIRDF
ncbi:MAG: MFS transporter [Ruminococcus sp.]|nr:MFS transporter [Candidatus Apopatosoma intestinale]